MDKSVLKCKKCAKTRIKCAKTRIKCANNG
jgi:hypothetical protein